MHGSLLGMAVHRNLLDTDWTSKQRTKYGLNLDKSIDDDATVTDDDATATTICNATNGARYYLCL
jgi:hypothetical protein